MWRKKWERRTRETKNRERERDFVSHVPLLDEKEIEHMVMEKNKHNEILSKCTGEDLLEEQSKGKEILNI